MNSQDEPGGQLPVSRDDLAEALSIMRAAVTWTLAPARWAAVDRSAVALTAALAAGDIPRLQNEISALALLGPVRQAVTSVATVRVPESVRTHVMTVIGVLEELQAPAHAAPQFLPVAIYLSDGSVHDQVERAVEQLIGSARLRIVERGEPVSGSWFRRMRAATGEMAHSPAGQEILLATAHAADSRLVLRQDAEVTAMLMHNLGPVITALQPTRDAVVRAGALLIVKIDWMVAVHQLTSRQQLILDHAPDLEAAPHKILKALGLPAAEPDSAIPGGLSGEHGPEPAPG